MAVPKATVDENGDLFCWKNEIGPTKKPGAPPPSLNAVPHKMGLTTGRRPVPTVHDTIGDLLTADTPTHLAKHEQSLYSLSCFPCLLKRAI